VLGTSAERKGGNMKVAVAGGLALLVVALAACTSIQINMRDGTARIENCSGVTFGIIVGQGGMHRNAKAVASGDVVKFKSNKFDDIDFAKAVEIIVYAETIPHGSDCPLQMGETYVLKSQTLSSVVGEPDVYAIDLADFEKQDTSAD
jgi:hypothetical protein